MKQITLTKMPSDDHYGIGYLHYLCCRSMRKMFGVTAKAIKVKASTRAFKGSTPIEVKTSHAESGSRYGWKWRLPINVQPRGRWKDMDGGASRWLQRHFAFKDYEPKTIHVSFAPVVEDTTNA